MVKQQACFLLEVLKYCVVFFFLFHKKVLAQLRAQRLERLQQQQAVAQASRVYQELQQQSRQVAQSAVLTPSVEQIRCTADTHQSPATTPTPVPRGPFYSGASRRVFRVARWFYQLFVVFFCSLNPQWRPLTAFVVPDPSEAEGSTQPSASAESQAEAPQAQQPSVVEPHSLDTNENQAL